MAWDAADPGGSRQCRNCRNFDGSQSCRAHPPVIVTTFNFNGERELKWMWPQIRPTHWCGEHVQVEAKLPKDAPQ